jgi:SOS-response transcriptional repressor LexA
MANIDASDHAWLDYCKEHALSPLTRSKPDRRPWLQREADHLKPAMDLTGDLQNTFRSMLRELIDYRLAQHRDRAGAPAAADSFECKLLQNSGHNPILKLPPRASRNIPDGDIEVHLPDGTIRIFGFRKEYINKASTPGKNVNELPDLLRGWFGLNAGRPGTNFRVRFSYSPDGLWIEPDQREVAALDSRRGIPFYPDLRAAAGHTATATAHLEEQRVWLPIDKPDPALFAVRVSGSSMDGRDGGTDPMRDGDWAIMRFDRAAPGSALLDRVVLVQTEDDTFGTRYQLKRLKRVDGRYELHSDNPAGPTIVPTDASTVIARLERAIAPESLGPSPGTQLDDDALAGAFGLDELLPRSGRYGGHLFVFIDAPGVVSAPDRIKYTVEQRRPSETCYVLAQVEPRTWRYLGVGRFREEDNCWVIPEMDHATWRKWGSD